MIPRQMKKNSRNQQKTPKTINQKKRIESRLLDAILDDLKDRSTKPIRPFDLRHLGYVLPSGFKIMINSTPYEVRAVADEETLQQPDFCFLLSKQSGNGLIMPHRFEHYIELVKKDQEEAQLINEAKG